MDYFSFLLNTVKNRYAAVKLKLSDYQVNDQSGIGAVYDHFLLISIEYQNISMHNEDKNDATN